MRLVRPLATLALLSGSLWLAACNPAPSATRGGPVVLITLEALRADAVGALGGEPGLTPNLDAFARQADWAGRAISPSSWGVPAMASLFTGLAPWLHHAVLDGDDAHLAQDLITLPKAFKALGYRTAGFSSGHWYTAAFGYDRGFDSFDEVGKNRDAAELLAALEDSRQLVWVHVPEPQAPYVRRDWLLPRLGGAGPAGGRDLPATVEPLELQQDSDPAHPAPAAVRQRLRSMYRLNAAWADEKVGRLLEALRASGQWERSLVVVTSAFGEELGEHGMFGHGGDLERESLEVPLIVKLPSWWQRPFAPPRGQRVALARLWSTLVEAAGGRPPPAAALSLFHRAPAGVLSELYFGNGSNLFSWVEGDDQLLWESRFAPAAPRYFRASLEAMTGAGDSNRPGSLGAIAARLFAGFAATPPLSGDGQARLTLARWDAGGGSRRLDAPRRTAELARRLGAAWGAFVPEESTPEDEDREWLDQLPRPEPPAPGPAKPGVPRLPGTPPAGVAGGAR
jgi:arylsulfatase A-like enzyme